MNGPRQRPDPLGFEIPDLDLPPPKASASQAKLPAVNLSESGERKAVSRAGLFSELPAGPVLDLDLGSPISSARYADAPAHEVAGRAGFEVDSQLPALAGITVAPEGRANWPSGVSEDRAELQFDRKLVLEHARFGTPFSLGLLNVIYVLRVFLQRRRLRRELLRCEAELGEAEASRDELLAELAEDKRAELEQSEAFQRLLAPLGEVDSEHRKRNQREQANIADHDAELRRLDAELSLLQPRLEAERRARSELLTVKAQREQNLQRLEARSKRAAIELRAFAQSGQAEQEARMRAQQQALEPEIAAARAAFEATQAEHDVRARAERDLNYQIGEIERKKRDTRARFQKQTHLDRKSAGSSQARRTRMLADVGRAVLAARGGVKVEARVLERLREADASVAKAVRASELCVRAFDACERDKLAAGSSWLLGIVSALIAIVCYRLFA